MRNISHKHSSAYVHGQHDALKIRRLSIPGHAICSMAVYFFNRLHAIIMLPVYFGFYVIMLHI